MRQLAEIADIVSGYGFPEKLQGKASGDLPFFKVADISAAWKAGERLLTKANNYITSKEADQIRARAYPKGTIVFAKIGEAIKLNRRAILGQPSLIDNNVMGLIPRASEIDDLYLFYFMLTVKLGDISQATTVPSVRKSDVKAISVPVVPLKEQELIVAEIEKQFSRLDEAVAGLKRIKANLKRYKAAVLKAAVEGELTEQWRKAHPNVETGAELLKSILAERKKKWEEKNPGKKYKEPVAPVTSNLPELPEGWGWVTVGGLLDDIEAGKSFKCEERPPTKDEVGVVKVSAVTWGEFDEAESKTCFENRLINERFLIRPGDFLFSRANTIELVGACVIAKKVTIKVMLSDKILRLRLLGGLDDWVLYNLRSKLGRQEIERLATGNQESMRNIGQDRIRAIRIPLPPGEESGLIVAEIERRFSLVREGEAQVDANLKRAERLRQSILKRAFSGNLVIGGKYAKNDKSYS